MSEQNKTLLVKDICAWFENEDGKVSVFWGVSFQVKPGEIIGIFGPNGCGKSTLLRTIVGIHPTMTGEIQLPARNSGESQISMIPQRYRESFFDWASLKMNLLMTFPNAIKENKKNRQLVEQIKGELDLDLDLRLRPNQSSGGMVQQAAMIRALANDPDMLIADEPFSALDVEVASRIRRSFRKTVKNRNVVALIVLHDLESILEVCDKVLVIPGKPFSTTDIENHGKAFVLENRHLDEKGKVEQKKEKERRSFVDIMKELFEQEKCV